VFRETIFDVFEISFVKKEKEKREKKRSTEWDSCGFPLGSAEIV